MGLFDKLKKKKEDKNRQLTIHEKWAMDIDSYKNENYKAKIKEGPCCKCVYRVKGNALKCSKFDSIPKEIIFNQKKCESRIEDTIKAHNLRED